ncbi:MAG: glutamine synthetase III [Eubacteriales bacterium]|nr:glutamine synthetase III [Eubacteriales bacterium]
MFIDGFGSMVFSEKVMKERLSRDAFDRLMKVRNEGSPMDRSLADEVAAAMKDWAVENGATHFTHWFQPMTGSTAEKHDAFLDRDKDDNPILELSGKTLIKGEADASSFPSGGIRETFEARGYTQWDPTSDAFVREDTLCIPTSFGSFDGAVLDKKTPLLRSLEVLSQQAKRLLKCFGQETKYVYPSVGLEQEYFLINKEDYAKRRDLILTERTLFGAPTPKGQVLEDHYYGTIRPRVKAYMKELDEELWKVGIYSKTEHNEVAPCQHEMAPIFARANIAVDSNQLTMDIMKKVANRHGFVCLLHEKPFEGINGSGKHNNWSLTTAEGENLFKPGKEPEKTYKFLLFIAAVVKAVDDYQELLRVSVASAGNDHRLGGNEAPPAIISMYLGDKLRTIVDSIINATDLKTAYEKAAKTEKNDDRNRTSPFAFTGNKFEFRMPGSAENVSCTNYILNTAAAESLKQFADRLEKFTGKPEFESEVKKLIREELTGHERILFEGNGYSNEWVKEAKRRGLANIKSTPEAFAHYGDEKNVRLLTSHGILSAEEIKARTNIGVQKYTNITNIEARTMLIMAEKEIMPAVIKYSSEIAFGIESKQALGLDVDHELKLLEDINSHVKALGINNEKLKKALEKQPADAMKAAMNAYKKILPVMEEERCIVDELEVLVDKQSWPYPDYTDILYYV